MITVDEKQYSVMLDHSERFGQAQKIARQSLCICNTAKNLNQIAKELIELILEGDDTLRIYAEKVPDVKERSTVCPCHPRIAL